MLSDLLERRCEQVRLDAEAADAWLRALNDVRLALGTRLAWRRDRHRARSSTRRWCATRPRPGSASSSVYAYLGVLQESLVGALMDSQ